LLALVAGAAPVYFLALLAYAVSPVTLEVGYRPAQPVEHSHAMHAGELGMDCRYCHYTVERAAHAALPPTATCMNCHALVKTDTPKAAPFVAKHVANLPILWRRVGQTPGYVYFDHSAHTARGVGCVSCHGRVDKMEQTYQAEPFSMGWCLDCHRRPEQHLRPSESVARMDWQPPAGQDPLAYGRLLREQNQVNPSTDCATCHR
jgi:hypothetical protein